MSRSQFFDSDQSTTAPPPPSHTTQPASIPQSNAALEPNSSSFGHSSIPSLNQISEIPQNNTRDRDRSYMSSSLRSNTISNISPLLANALGGLEGSRSQPRSTIPGSYVDPVNMGDRYSSEHGDKFSSRDGSRDVHHNRNTNRSHQSGGDYDRNRGRDRYDNNRSDQYRDDRNSRRGNYDDRDRDRDRGTRFDRDWDGDRGDRGRYERDGDRRGYGGGQQRDVRDRNDRNDRHDDKDYYSNRSEDQFGTGRDMDGAGKARFVTDLTRLATSSQAVPFHSNPQLVLTTRPYRRIYVGGLPSTEGLTPSVIKGYFEVCLKKLGFTTPDPVMEVSFHHHNNTNNTNNASNQHGSATGTRNYCFVEFRSILDADAVLQLMNGFKMGQSVLDLARPRDFVGIPPDLKNYIVDHPPGKFLPPSTYHNNPPLLPTESIHVHAGSKGEVGVLPKLPAGELTIAEELKWLESLPKLPQQNTLAEFLPLLTPLSCVNAPIVNPYKSMELNVNVSSNLNGVAQQVRQPTACLQVISIGPERVQNDNDWLNLADDFCHYIDTELELTMSSRGNRNYFTDLVIPRPKGSENNETNPHPEIDSSGIYTVQSNLKKPNGTQVQFFRKVHGPRTEVVQGGVGSLFIQCTSTPIALLLFNLLNRAMYAKQLLRVQFSDVAMVERLIGEGKGKEEDPQEELVPSMGTENMVGGTIED